MESLDIERTKRIDKFVKRVKTELKRVKTAQSCKSSEDETADHDLTSRLSKLQAELDKGIYIARRMIPEGKTLSGEVDDPRPVGALSSEV